MTLQPGDLTHAQRQSELYADHIKLGDSGETRSSATCPIWPHKADHTVPDISAQLRYSVPVVLNATLCLPQNTPYAGSGDRSSLPLVRQGLILPWTVRICGEFAGVGLGSYLAYDVLD